ncbi:Molybdate transporter [Quillaja saponaria]|uniref:Molybdate transporter n=1 Tax=Quillaja saponaria TaxID=32244 RepID=A0AAD7LRC5_QUISA|nr:Molybdate transporter [Quillaja saponaria]
MEPSTEVNQSEVSTTTPLLRNRWRHPRIPNTIKLKTTLSSEISGSVGDLGTFIPIVLAMSLVSHIDLTTTLLFTSLYNIVTGLLFGLPMPVQPMKSIAAVAISESTHLTVPQISAAGLSVAAVLLFLGCTGLMSVLYRFIPLPVVRGVQLSQGLSFAFSAIKYIRYTQDLYTSKSGPPRSWLGFDGLIVALTGLLFLILTTGAGVEHTSLDDRDDTVSGSNTDYVEGGDEIKETHQQNQSRSTVHKRLSVLSAIPAALIVFLFGLLLCFLRDPSIIKDLKFGPSKISLVRFTLEDWKIGFVRAAIPQIPLSILNSVIAVCKLSGDLFPESEASAMKVSVSVGVMNFVGCWFGAMPVCHGAGGLAGQYRFGGRSGASVVLLGIAKLVLALVFGNSFGRILNQFPVGILGVLLLFAGVELAMASKDMNTKEESFVMLVCAAVSLTGSSAALGFGCGIVLFLLLKLREVDCSGSGFFNSKKSKFSNDEESSLIP